MLEAREIMMSECLILRPCCCSTRIYRECGKEGCITVISICPADGLLQRCRAQHLTIWWNPCPLHWLVCTDR